MALRAVTNKAKVWSWGSGYRRVKGKFGSLKGAVGGGNNSAIVAGDSFCVGRSMVSRHSSSVSCPLTSLLLRSLRDHYVEVSKMTPPPRANPPSSFTVVEGSLEGGGAIFKRSYFAEEIIISSVMHIPGGDDKEINQLLVNVAISKPGQQAYLHLTCRLCPDILEIRSVTLIPRMEDSEATALLWNGPTSRDLSAKMKDSLLRYIEERGINEDLFPVLKAWLYLKERRNLMRGFKSFGTFVKGP